MTQHTCTTSRQYREARKALTHAEHAVSDLPRLVALGYRFSWLDKFAAVYAQRNAAAEQFSRIKARCA